MKNYLGGLAKSNNLTVNFLGLVDNDVLINEYQKYKVFVSSSDYEGNSKVILEAMAAGCIVVAKDIQNNRDHLNSLKVKDSSEWREYATKCMVEIMDNKV